MKKFQIIEKTIQVKEDDFCKIKEGITHDCEFPEVFEVFKTLEEAKKAFEKYKNSEITLYRNGRKSFVDVVEYYLEEEEEEDDGYIYVGVWDTSKMSIKAVDDDGRVLAIYDNYIDAYYHKEDDEDISPSVEFDIEK